MEFFTMHNVFTLEIQNRKNLSVPNIKFFV